MQALSFFATPTSVGVWLQPLSNLCSYDILLNVIYSWIQRSILNKTVLLLYRRCQKDLGEKKF